MPKTKMASPAQVFSRSSQKFMPKISTATPRDSREPSAAAGLTTIRAGPVASPGVIRLRAIPSDPVTAHSGSTVAPEPGSASK